MFAAAGRCKGHPIESSGAVQWPTHRGLGAMNQLVAAQIQETGRPLAASKSCFPSDGHDWHIKRFHFFSAHISRPMLPFSLIAPQLEMACLLRPFPLDPAATQVAHRIRTVRFPRSASVPSRPLPPLPPSPSPKCDGFAYQRPGVVV